MDPKENAEHLINKLINQRRELNEAFTKLLLALGNEQKIWKEKIRSEKKRKS